MSEVKMVKRVLVGASVSVLAGLLMSSAALAEDDAAPVDGEEVTVTVEVIDGEGVPVDEVLVDPVPEEVTITLEGEIDPEVVDPVCIECSGEGPDVSIDPIELEGEVIDAEVTNEEVMQNDVPVSVTDDVKRVDHAVKPREDRDTTRAARSAHPGETPRWLKKLFKIK